MHVVEKYCNRIEKFIKRNNFHLLSSDEIACARQLLRKWKISGREHFGPDEIRQIITIGNKIGMSAEI